MFGQTIIGERITLAPITPEMLPDFVRWIADTDVTRYMGFVGAKTLEQEKEWFARVSTNDTDIVWAIMVGDRTIGSTGIHQINWQNRRAITGNLIGERSEWGKGYGSEAVRLRTEYAFTQTTLEKLQTDTFFDNFGSRRCLEKSGYRQYGVARRHIFRNGKWHDMWLADLLREEWLEAQARNA